MLATRVDIIFDVSKPCKFTHAPGTKHYQELIHLLQYLRDKTSLGLKFYNESKYYPLHDLLLANKIENQRNLITFIDSSWQDCPDTGKSTWSY